MEKQVNAIIRQITKDDEPFLEHAFPALVLSVRSNNPAKRLYEKLGFVIVSESINRVGTESFNMIARFDYD